MENLSQYLLPYLLSQVFVIILLMLAYRSTRVARILFAVMFIGAFIVNFSTATQSPDAYLDYGKMALPLYRQFIEGWFSQHITLMVPLIAIGQLSIGIGMLLQKVWVKAACVGVIIFSLAITPLMVGSAFPFPLLMAWAAIIVLRRDEKAFIWKTAPPPIESVARDGLFPAWFLSAIALLLAIVASVAGLFAAGIYRDNSFVQTAWLANDRVTLLVVAPALTLALLRKRKMIAQVLWAGLLAYLVYNYAFYLFGAAFNGLFLAYVGIVATALWGLVALLRQMPVQKMEVPVKVGRWVAGYLFFIAAMLMMVELPPAAGFLFTGKVPATVIETDSNTAIVYALDLTLVVPACVVAGYWMLKQQGWGYLLSALLLVKAASYGLVLFTAALLQMRRGVSDPLLPFYFFILVGGLAGLNVMLRSLKVVTIIDRRTAAREVGVRRQLQAKGNLLTP